jgi:ubiquinol-cytochrome c reductase cytochrome b subunit
MVRVVLFGSYKSPREATWLSGLVLFALILAFSLTGYLLPWDQRAYWATVVTLNISRLTPGAGDLLAGVLQGGASIGALTLTRWYALHVIFLPAALAGLVILHLVLMRRHGISGPVRPREGDALPFYPWQAARDTAVVAVVLVALTAFAWNGAPPLEAPADPADSTYLPRPEWYFLGLFQLLKYFPGRWEVVGAMIVPGVAAAFLALLPWIDRRPVRDPRRRPLVVGAFVLGLAAAAGLTSLGWMDRPKASGSAQAWSLREIGGRAFTQTGGCAACHAPDGMSDPLERAPSTRGPEWLTGHIVDPEMIAPGLREPPTAVGEREVAAMVAYVRQLSRGSYPGFDARTETAARVFARYCVGCHVVDGDGGTEGPDLSAIGAKHDAAFLKRLVSDPESVDPDAEMPSFARRLTPAEVDAIAEYLAARK